MCDANSDQFHEAELLIFKLTALDTHTGRKLVADLNKARKRWLASDLQALRT